MGGFPRWLSLLLGLLVLVPQWPIQAQTDPADSTALPSAKPDESNLHEFKAVCAKALYKAVKHLSTQKASQLGDVYGAIQLDKIYPNPGLKQFIELGTSQWKDDPSAWWILPDKPKLALPNPLPSGAARFQLMMLLPHTEPREQADKLLFEYLRGNFEDYVLTHQVLIFEVAKEHGFVFPPDIVERQDHLLSKMHAEQQADDYFGDLYAERAMLLLRYGKPSVEDARRWIENLISTQTDNGAWNDTRIYKVRMPDATEAKFVVHPTHSTVLAANAIALFLVRFADAFKETVAPAETCLAAMERAVAAVVASKNPTVPEVFQAVHLAHLFPKESLRDWIDSSKLSLVNDPSAWYILAGTPRLSLPRPLPRGKARFEWTLNAPKADPVESAREIFSEFLRADLDGMLLTHQLFLINIAESLRLELAPEEVERKERFMQKVRSEFNQNAFYSHLLVRLTVLRLLYDKELSMQEAARVAHLVLEAQGEDGLWRDPDPYQVRYDGESFPIAATPSLITLDSAYLLALYLKRFHE